MHMPDGKNGFTHIAAARDDLTGTCEAIPIRAQTAKVLADFFWNNIYCRYGIPLVVVTDNGPEVREAFEILMKRMGVPHVRIMPYNKRANGVVERGHFTSREAILKACHDDVSKWPDAVAAAVFADRITVSRVTGFSPYQLLHGTDPILPFDLTEATFMVEGFHSGMSTADLLALRIRQLQRRDEDIAQAAETLKKARFQSKAQFEKRFIKRLQTGNYAKGECVMYRNNAIEVELNRKGKDRYFGPFEVIDRSKGGSYSLKEVDGTRIVHRIAPFRIVPYITRDHWFMKTGWMGDSDESGPDSGSESETNFEQEYSQSF